VVGLKIEIKEDKQGLGTTKRNKKRFEAQQMLVQLEVLAHIPWSGHVCGWQTIVIVFPISA